MEVFSASITIEASQEAEFRAQFEQTTERWGQSPSFLWSSLLRSDDSNNKFIVCTGWNISDDRVFAEGLGALTPFQQMFGRVEEFQSVDTFENLLEATEAEIVAPVENLLEKAEEPELAAAEASEAPINWQTGKPANWTEDNEPVQVRVKPERPVSTVESSTLLADFLDQRVKIWTQDIHYNYHDEGILIACDEQWVQILNTNDQIMLFPTLGMRLIRILS